MGAPDLFLSSLDALIASAAQTVMPVAARAVAPRKPITVSEHADLHFRLSEKGSAEPGQWRTSRNPPLREIMDCMSVRSGIQEVAAMICIQFGKTMIELAVVNYIMDHAPGPTMVCLPGEASLNTWVNQKLAPFLEVTETARNALTSTNSRNAANQREFKDFTGGQLFLEHAGNPQRLKSKSIRWLLVDEYSEFSVSLKGDDPDKLLDGRTSAFPATYKRLDVSTPGIKGLCRMAEKFEKSDQRRYHVPCPHCGHHQHLQWAGLSWTRNQRGDVNYAWYTCEDCGAVIDEHHKDWMFRDARAGGQGHWVPHNPGARIRGYHINCLYYQPGLGPTWVSLAQEWLDAQNDPAKLKTFICDRLAEAWDDPTRRKVQVNLIQDRAENFPLRIAPLGVIWITAGVDTQDNRLEVQIMGWGRGLKAWTLDYVVLFGDPAEPEVWTALTDLLNRPIQHEKGMLLPVSATLIDARGHRTEAVKEYVRSARIRRPMYGYGAKAANAPALGRPKLEDLKTEQRTDANGVQTAQAIADKTGIQTWQVGTVTLKHHFFQRLAADAEQDDREKRHIHFPDSLGPEYFKGLISETFDPAKGRYIKRRGARNEPLDTWIYARAAAQHPELRLHTRTQADWAQDEARILDGCIKVHPQPAPAPPPENQAAPAAQPRQDKQATSAAPPAAAKAVQAPIPTSSRLRGRSSYLSR